MRLMMISAVLCVFAATPLLADQPGRGWIPVGALAKVIERQGYHMTKVEADDGHWEGEMTQPGKIYEFHADPRTGRLTKVERDYD